MTRTLAAPPDTLPPGNTKPEVPGGVWSVDAEAGRERP
jgi:hypothetical protein